MKNTKVVESKGQSNGLDEWGEPLGSPNVVMMHKKGTCYNCVCLSRLRTIPLHYESKYIYARLCYPCYDNFLDGGLLRRDIHTVFVSAAEFKGRECIGYLDHGVKFTMPEDFANIGENY